jgi:hypothetical protein
MEILQGHIAKETVDTQLKGRGHRISGWAQIFLKVLKASCKDKHQSFVEGNLVCQKLFAAEPKGDRMLAKD